MADIPINAVHRRVQYTSSGSAGPYSFSFAMLAEADLAVYDSTTLKTLTTHFTVALNANGTGSITFTSGNEPTSGNIVTIESNQALARTSDFSTGGDFKAATINTELDQLTIQDQQLETWFRRCVQLDSFANRDVSSSGAGPLIFPYDDTPADQANKFIIFDSAGTALTTSSNVALPSSLTALNYIRANSGASAYEMRTPTEVKADISLSTSDSPTFTDLTLSGNLTVNGSTTTVDTTNMLVKDNLIELGTGTTGTPANDAGIVVERGDSTNAVLVWDESADGWVGGTASVTGTATGNITITPVPFTCSTITATAGTLAGLTSFAMSAGATITGGVNDTDSMSDASAVTLATSESIKAYADNNAPENGVKFAFESTTTDTDQGAGKVWLNNGTPSSATVLYVDDVEAGGVSVNAWVDTWDDVSNAVARGYIYIASYGTTNAILVYKVTSTVVSASTYSKIPVTHVLTVGTISDADNIGLTFVPAGADGAGDLTAANNLSDVASASTSLANLGGTTEANAVALALALG